MKNQTRKCGGYDITTAFPENEKEYNALAKKEGALLEDGINQTWYHSTMSEVRAKAVTLIEEKYKAKRREVGTGKFEDVDGKQVEVTKDEGFDIFINRVAAENKLGADKPFADIFTSMSVGGKNEVKFDPSVQARSGKPPTLPNRFKDAAVKIITAKQVPQFGARYEKVLGKKLVYDTALQGDALITAIGWLAREMKLEEEKNAGLESFTGKV